MSNFHSTGQKSADPVKPPWMGEFASLCFHVSFSVKQALNDWRGFCQLSSSVTYMHCAWLKEEHLHRLCSA